MRDTTEKNKLPSLHTLAPSTASFPSPAPASVTVDATFKAPDSNISASSTSLTIFKPVPFSGGIKSFLDRAADEGLAILQSPRVRIFRMNAFASSSSRQ